MTTDPTNGLPVIDAGGEPRVLAALMPPPSFAAPNPWAESQPVLPRAKWMPSGMRKFRNTILDQARSSACVAFSSAKAFAYLYAFSGQAQPPTKATNGFPWSCYGLYSQINGRRDAGAQIEDGANALLKGGVPLFDDVPAGAMFTDQIPAKAFEGAKRFRARDVLNCQTFDEIGSALALGWVVVSGIPVGSRFNTLDADGVPGKVMSQADIMGWHAVTSVDLFWSSKRNEWLFDSDNSWSTSWGDSGRFRMAPETFAGGRIAAWALRGVVDDPLSALTDPPPVV